MKLKTLSLYMHQSVFCGVAGSAKFVLALTSYVQASLYLRVFSKNLFYDDAPHVYTKRKTAIVGMREGALPAAEMFVLTPIMFYALHAYAHMPILACIAICWAAMFLVCLFVRVTGIIKKCPTLYQHIYEPGYPFAMFEVDEEFVPGRSQKFDLGGLGEPLRPSLFKSTAVAVAFLPLRCVSLLAILVLSCVETLSLAPVLLSDVFAAVANKIKRRSATNTSPMFAETKERLTVLKNLGGAMCIDVLWVLSLGVVGGWIIQDGLVRDRFDNDPAEQLSDTSVQPQAANTNCKTALSHDSCRAM